MSEPHSPSAEFQQDAPSHSPRRPSRTRRGRSRTPRSLSASEEEENYDYPPRRRRKPQNKGGLPAVDELQDTVGGVTQTATGAVGNAAGALTGGSGKKQQEDTLSLRLDLNLDVYVKLTAKVHGDLTLSLL